MISRKKSWDDAGVSEVIGTILILGMTVTLFTVVLMWVMSVPTPSADVRVDMQGTLVPLYKTNGNWDGVTITLRHNGGESLLYLSTTVTINIYHPNGARDSDVLKNKGTLASTPWRPPQDIGKSYGLIDGSDDTWNVGERWVYTCHFISGNPNKGIGPSDQVEVLIIDTYKSVLLWERYLQGRPGLNPPVFVDKWADLIRPPPRSTRQ